MSIPAGNLRTQPYWEQMAGGPEIFALALQSSTADPNERDKALPLAEECLKRLLNRDPVSGRFHVHLLPRSEIGVVDNTQILVAIDGQDRHLYVPAELIGPVFPYFLDRFQVLRMFCLADPMRAVSAGYAVWDFLDGSRTGSYPSISFCSNLANAYLISDPQFLYHKGYQQLRIDIQLHWIPWHERKPSLFWRGSTTGIRRYTPKQHGSIDDWRWLQRLHLCDVAARSPHRNVLDVGVAVGGEGGLPSIPEKFLRDAVDRAGFSRPRCDKLDFLGYRYLIDIDGYANSWNGLFSAMLMGATIFKIASPFGYRQWFYDKLVAWENYIPVSADLSDLDDRIEWALSHTDQCAAMGRSIAALASELTYETQLARSAEIVRDAFTTPVSGVFSGVLQSLARHHETARIIPPENTVYLMTAHRTFVGIDEKSTLVQLDASKATLPMLVPFERTDDGDIRINSLLAGFEIQTSSEGVSFTKNGKYLCALYNASTLVADRDIPGPWEVFTPIAHDMMVHLVGQQDIAPRTLTKLERQAATAADPRSAPGSIRGDKVRSDQATGLAKPKLTEEQQRILQAARALAAKRGLDWKALSAEERSELRRSVRRQSDNRPKITVEERTPTKRSSLQLLRNQGLRVGTIIDVGVQNETRELIEAFPDKKHLLVEPVIENYKEIEKNYANIDYELIRAAASDEDGEGLLEVHTHPGTGPVHTSSLIDGPHQRATRNLPHLEGYFREVDERHIAQVRLDTITRKGAYEKPYLLKLDVDGNEMKILEGASETLKDTSCVIIEAPLSHMFLRGNYLQDLGFVLWDIVDLGYYCDQLSYLDLVFLSAEERQRAFNPWLEKFDPTKSVRFLH